MQELMMTADVPGLELGMQELETMEAPGFWDTGGGAAAGGAFTYLTLYMVTTGAVLT